MAKQVRPSYFPSSFLMRMDAMHTVFYFVISCLRLATLLHLAGVNGKVYLIIHEFETRTLVEVVEELLRGVKRLGGWVFLLYQSILSILFHSKISDTLHKPLHIRKGKA